MKTVYLISDSYQTIDMALIRQLGTHMGMDFSVPDKNRQERFKVLNMLSGEAEQLISFCFLIACPIKRLMAFINTYKPFKPIVVELNDDYAALIATGTLAEWSNLIINKSNKDTLPAIVQTLNEVQMILEEKGLSHLFNTLEKISQRTHFYLEQK